MESLDFSWSRRQFCGVGTLSAVGLLAARAMALADAAAPKATLSKDKRPRSLIVLWLNGGPSQLETFDPHPGSAMGGPTRSIATSLPGVKIAEGLPRLAEMAQDFSLIRSMVTKEGEHERAQYQMKTGYRPIPALVHPTLGAICAHELPVAGTEIPRYVAIQSSDQHARGGFLGDAFDPFKIGDPVHPPADMAAPVDQVRRDRRVEALDVLENALRRRNPNVEARTLHRERIARALKMMDSTQVNAFRVDQEPASLRAEFGDSPFGRGCLAAARLVETGVRCVEVELGGWDTHADNFDLHARRNATLDPAFSALLRELRRRDLWDSTLVLCTGEFGRTPKINPLEGRDHWPKGFSLALAGGLIRTGQVIGATNPDQPDQPTDPVSVETLFATLLTALGIEANKEFQTPIGRPIKLCEGKPLKKLLWG